MPGLLADGVRAVLFDFDGTLVDSNAQTGWAISDALSRAGYQKTPEQIMKVLEAGSLEGALRDWFGITGEQRTEIFVGFRQGIYADQINTSKPFEPAGQLLGEIRDLGVTVGVVTNRREVGAHEGIEAAGWQGLFEVVVGQDTTDHAKPHPDPALHALDALGLAPEQALIVGDNETDVGCGVAAGLRSVVAIAEGEKGERLASLGATHVCPDLHRVRELLLHG